MRQHHLLGLIERLEPGDEIYIVDPEGLVVDIARLRYDPEDEAYYLICDWKEGI